MTKKILLIFPVLFSTAQCIFGQLRDASESSKSLSRDNYVNGSIVTLEGDTLKGQINDLLWVFNPEFFEFKNSSGVIKKYEPAMVKAFILDDRMYRSYEVNYDSTIDDVNRLSFNPLPAIKKSHLLLKVLVASKKSLLEYNTNNRIYFFIESDGKIQELEDHPFLYKTPSMAVESKATSRHFIMQLQDYFKDCPGVNISKQLRYTKSTLTPLFTKYNSCIGQPIKDVSRTPKSKFVLEAVADFAYEGYGGFEKSFGNGLGLLVGLNPSHKLYKTTWYVEFTYQRVPDQSGNILLPSYPNTNLVISRQTIKTNLSRINGGFRNRIGHGKSFYTIGASYNLVYGSYTDGMYIFDEKDLFIPFLGVRIGAGTWIGKFIALNLRYDAGTSNLLNGVARKYSSLQLAVNLKIR